MTEEYERYKAAQAARWLEHVAKLRRKIASIKDEIDEARAMADGVQAVCYDGMPRSAGAGDGMERAVISLQDMIARFTTELAEYVEARQDAHDRLQTIDDPLYAECLTKHYILGWKWERVCVKMDYAYDGMMKLRRRALAEAYDVMPTEWRDPMHRAI